MPTYIVKADPEVDWYALWSTIVDAPVAFGSRAELEAAEPNMSADRFERADRNGSSVSRPGWHRPLAYGWDDEEFILALGAPPAPHFAWWELPRVNLRAYCEALGRGETGHEYLRLERERMSEPTYIEERIYYPDGCDPDGYDSFLFQAGVYYRGAGKWCVATNREAHCQLSRTGKWLWGPSHMSAARWCRFDFETACRLAAVAANERKVNGFTWREWEERE